MEDENDKFAYCEMCGWEGLRTKLAQDSYRNREEVCPECDSDRTWWGKPDQ